MSSIIGWRTCGKMKKQHLAKRSYEGDIVFFCRETTPDPLSVSGRSSNPVESPVTTDATLPLCKICLKEVKRINKINGNKGKLLPEMVISDKEK